jgi:hypothetical protein
MKTEECKLISLIVSFDLVLEPLVNKTES